VSARPGWLLIALALAACAHARPVAWGPLRWGMSRVDVRQALGAEFTMITVGPSKPGDEASWTFRRELAGETVEAFVDTAGLVRVIIERRVGPDVAIASRGPIEHRDERVFVASGAITRRAVWGTGDVWQASVIVTRSDGRVRPEGIAWGPVAWSMNLAEAKITLRAAGMGGEAADDGSLVLRGLGVMGTLVLSLEDHMLEEMRVIHQPVAEDAARAWAGGDRTYVSRVLEDRAEWTDGGNRVQLEISDEGKLRRVTETRWPVP
jgi:hypothetical protein